MIGVPTSVPVPLMAAPQIQAPIRVAQPGYGKLNLFSLYIQKFSLSI
jgi:hypothetical protein